MSFKILAVDTSTENCSVALKVGEDIFAFCEMAPREHTTKILPMVERVLVEAGLKLNQLDALAFGRGPGSFTGVRIGVGIAQGLAFGADLPLIGVSTLAAMAQQSYRKCQSVQVLSAIDARMGEIYVGGFLRLENGDWETTEPEVVIPPESLNPTFKKGVWSIAGTGWQTYPDLAEQLKLNLKVELHTTGVLFPEAQDMLILAEQALMRGEGLDAQDAQPVYLRDTVAWKKLPGRQ